MVDPQRDIDRVLAPARASTASGSRDVFETHIHNDYVTGGLALARRTGAAYHVNAADEVAFERTPIRDGEVVAVGEPDAGDRAGHARAHLHPPVLRAHRRRAEGRTPVRRRVLRRLAAVRRRPAAPTCSAPSTPTPSSATSTPPPTGSPTLLPDEAAVFPTHGFGSFCSATQSEATDVDHRPGEAGQPGADPGRGDLRPRAARRPRRLAGVLRPHGPGQRRRARRARPVPPGAGRRRRAARGASRPASGSSTCATAPRSRPATRRAP